MVDLTEFHEKGVQVLRNFLPEDVKADLRRRAQEVIDLRAPGEIFIDRQDSQHLPFDWFEPLVRQSDIIDIMHQLYGPNIGAGPVATRILVKDKFFKGSVWPHQDWPYYPGDTRKVTVFLPCTKVSEENGGLSFLEKSHLYGPLCAGPLDPSMFPPMESVCPEVDVGDIILCDLMTWHYSGPSRSDAERIMIQFNYMPADDPCNPVVVAGTRSHDWQIQSRFDASPTPSVELNAKTVRQYFDMGLKDRAERWTRGLIFDDPNHAGAHLLLHDILAAKGDPDAAQHLTKARLAAFEILEACGKRDGSGAAEQFGWQALPVSWTDHVDNRPVEPGQPVKLQTPDEEWGYGATTELLPLEPGMVVRVTAASKDGQIGLCMVTEDYGTLASDSYMIRPSDGETAVVLSPEAKHLPVRILVRNHGDADKAGLAEVMAVEISR